MAFVGFFAASMSNQVQCFLNQSWDFISFIQKPLICNYYVMPIERALHEGTLGIMETPARGDHMTECVPGISSNCLLKLVILLL